MVYAQNHFACGGVGGADGADLRLARPIPFALLMSPSDPLFIAVLSFEDFRRVLQSLNRRA